MLSKQDHAIVLVTRKYGESDRIVSFFTRRNGKWNGIAKGARRSRRRFGGSLEIGSHVSLIYEEKPHRELVFLKEALLLTPNPFWRKGWRTIAIASYVLELAAKLSPEHQASPRKFLLLEQFLSSLEEGSAVSLLLEFQKHWLSLSGWGENLDRCGLCGRIWEGVESEMQFQAVFDHYWQHLLGKPLLSRGLLDEAFLV